MVFSYLQQKTELVDLSSVVVADYVGYILRDTQILGRHDKNETNEAHYGDMLAGIVLHTFSIAAYDP